MKISGRKEISSPEEVRWGFGLVVFIMLGLSVLLTVLAERRFSGTAWGYSHQEYSAALPSEGFVVEDLTNSLKTTMRGAAFAALRPEEKDEGMLKSWLGGFPGSEDTDLDLKLPGTAESLSWMPSFSSELPEDLDLLSQDLGAFDPIVLSTTDNGMRLPDDFDEELLGLEPPEPILAEVSATWKEHVVKSGETLSDIALKYGGITAQDILRANVLKDANRLAEQQIILVPNTPQDIEDTLEEVRTRKARVAALKERVVPLQTIEYTVAAGDSLWSIANTQNVEVDTLVGSNSFKESALLHPGLVLRIPNQDGIFYKLKKGDTVEAIARRYQVSLDRVGKVNPAVELASMKAGEEIFLPGARPEAIAEAPSASSKKTSASAPKAAKSSTVKTSRNYRWPLMGRINSPFGWRRHPITKRRDFHTGLDIKGGRGAIIRSAREGKVAYSGWMGGYGKVIVIDHPGGQSTLYAHCQSLLVKKGAKISAAQNIARVGTTGRTTGPHLHFEIRNGNSPVNPRQYLK